LSEAEKLQVREKAVLYLRHRLQKGFLSRDQAPQESEMAAMADFFTQLENYDNLEPSIIRVTKIHKVLKAIVKLVTIPKDEEYNFKKRSAAMLETWNKRMESDAEVVPASATAESKSVSIEGPITNGEAKAESTVEPSKEGAEAREGAEKEVEQQGAEKVVEEAEAKIDENNVEKAPQDTTMQDAEEPADTPAVKTAPAGIEKAEAGDVTIETVSKVDSESAQTEAAA
jgi:hypothetical protein